MLTLKDRDGVRLDLKVSAVDSQWTLFRADTLPVAEGERTPSRSFRVSILLLAVTRSMTKRSCVRVSGSQRSITIPSR